MMRSLKSDFSAFENQDFIRRDGCFMLVIMSIQYTLNPEHIPSFCVVSITTLYALPVLSPLILSPQEEVSQEEFFQT